MNEQTDISPPTAEDLARDAMADWQAIHDTFGVVAGQQLLPGKCPTAWVLAWIRREASLAKRVAELEAVIRCATAMTDDDGGDLDVEISNAIAKRDNRIAELEAENAKLRAERNASAIQLDAAKVAGLQAESRVYERVKKLQTKAAKLEAENAKLKRLAPLCEAHGQSSPSAPCSRRAR